MLANTEEGWQKVFKAVREQFGNQRIFNFRVMAVRDVKLQTRLSKNIYLSSNF